MSLDILFDVVVGAMPLAATYALVAIGWVLIFRATGILNFATGEYLVLGSYLVFWFVISIGVPFLIGLVLGLLLTAVISALMYASVLRPLQGEALFGPVMVTFGVAILMASIMTMIWGAHARVFTLPFDNNSYDLPGGAFVTTYGLATIATAIVVYGGLISFFRFSRFGTQMRATAANPLLASQRGINITLVFLVAFGMAMAFAALGGISFAASNVLTPAIAGLGLRAIAPALIGGLDSIGGALIGSIIVALVESMAVTQFGGGVRNASVFAVLLLTLAIRPHGLFGTPEIRRV